MPVGPVGSWPRCGSVSALCQPQTEQFPKDMEP